MYRNLLLMAVCLSLTLLSTGHGQVVTGDFDGDGFEDLVVLDPAKPPPAASPASKSLAEMFELALRSNPEVVQAEATVRQAEADLNQVRLKVMQEVITAYHEGRKQRELLGYYVEEAENYKRRFAVGQATQGEGNQAFRQVAATRASLAQTEARLLYILGTGYGKKSVAGPKSVTPTGPADTLHYRRVLYALDFGENRTSAPSSASRAFASSRQRGAARSVRRSDPCCVG